MTLQAQLGSLPDENEEMTEYEVRQYGRKVVNWIIESMEDSDDDKRRV